MYTCTNSKTNRYKSVSLREIILLLGNWNLANSSNGILDLVYYTDTKSLDMHLTGNFILVVVVFYGKLVPRYQLFLDALETFRIFSLAWRKLWCVPSKIVWRWSVIVDNLFTVIFRELANNTDILLYNEKSGEV